MRIRFAALLLLILLVACGRSGPVTATGPTTATPLPEATLPPTPATPLAILVIPADMPQDKSNLYQTTVYNLAQGSGLRFQVRNTLTTAELVVEPGLKVVIAFPPDPGLAELSTAAPTVQFLAVSIPGLTPSDNLSLIAAAGESVDKQAFLAGYIAAMLAKDYRTGIITLDTTTGKMVRDAFINGMHFYCGLCYPAFPPIQPYPAHIEIPADAPKDQWPAYAVGLHENSVEVAYVQQEIATTDLLENLAQFEMNIIGQALPAEDLRSNWIVSLQPQLIPAIQSIWPDLVAGKGGQTIAMPLSLTDINPDLLTPGKQRLAEEILNDLQTGYIGTGVQP